MSAQKHHLSPLLALYGLLCLTCLFLMSGGVIWLLVVLAALILASYVLRARLPSTWLPSLLFGGLFLALAILTTPQEGPRSPSTVIPPRPIFLFGQAGAILLVLQFYRPMPSDPLRPRLFTLLSGFVVLIAACNTFEEGLLRFLIPLLCVVLGLALRVVQNRPSTSRLSWALVGLALLGALGGGWFGTRAITTHKEKLTEWGNKFMSERPLSEQLGMSQQPMLGSTFGGRGTNARVLRLEGSALSSHLRGASFETYEGGRWWPPLNSRTFSDLEERDRSLSLPNLRTRGTVTVTRLQRNSQVVFLPLECFGLLVSEGDDIEWSHDRNGPIRLLTAQTLTYGYEEGPEGTQGLMATPQLKDPKLRERYLQLAPGLKELLGPLATKLTVGLSRPEEKIAAIAGYLLDNYPYSLSFDASIAPELPNLALTSKQNQARSDQIVAFLLANPKRGAHCEYFATAAALLLRCAGTPTRYVTGYFAHEEEPEGARIVRQRDAHAWCEAWIEGKGWVTVEATPPTGWPEQTKSSMEPWRRAWEWIEDRWYGLLGWIADRDPTQLGVVLLVPLAGVGLGALWQRRRRTARLQTDSSYTLAPELAVLAKRFEAALPTVSATQPWSEQLPLLPEHARPAAQRFVERYQRVRFGPPHELSKSELAPLESALQELEAALKQKPGSLSG